MSDYPMLISNKLHSFRNFVAQSYGYDRERTNFNQKKIITGTCFYHERGKLTLINKLPMFS